MKTTFLLLISLSLMTGCETLGGAWTKKSTIAFKQPSGGSLSIWNAEMSAAVTFQSGEICMQRALAVKTTDAETSVNVSKAILAIATSIESNSDGDSLADISSSIKQTAELLNTSTERTTFLGLGLFYLCQISANGGLTDTQTAELIRILTLSAAPSSTSSAAKTSGSIPAETITPGTNPHTPQSASIIVHQPTK
mgnify:CR=1 FL=1